MESTQQSEGDGKEMSEEINPWKALRFACDGLERICMGTADEADSSSIAEKALFAAIGHMGVSDIAVRELAARAGEDAPGSEPQPASGDVRPRENEPGWYDVTCGSCGEEFGTNFRIQEIECAECEARRCPHCATWFGGDL